MITKHKKFWSLSLSILAGLSVFTPHPASAAIARFFGWKFSDSEIWRTIIEYADAAGVICGIVPIPNIGCTVVTTTTVLVKVIDPPPTEILSGRVTIDFDPSNELLYAGWYGEFGANPLLPAPPVDGSTFDQNLLQFNSNPAMVSSNINIDQTNGRVVFEFDWGSAGFIPTLNLDSQGHFNILGMYFLPSSPVILLLELLLIRLLEQLLVVLKIFKLTVLTHHHICSVVFDLKMGVRILFLIVEEPSPSPNPPQSSAFSRSAHSAQPQPSSAN